MPGYENTMPNKVLLDLMSTNMRSLGLAVNNERRRSGRGSTDFGNVSRRVPGIQTPPAVTHHLGKPRHPIKIPQAASPPFWSPSRPLPAKSLAYNHHSLPI